MLQKAWRTLLVGLPLVGLPLLLLPTAKRIVLERSTPSLSNYTKLKQSPPSLSQKAWYSWFTAPFTWISTVAGTPGSVDTISFLVSVGSIVMLGLQISLLYKVIHMEDKRESAREKNKIEEMINEEIEGRLENGHAKGLKAKGVDGKEGKENRGNKQETDTNSKQQPKRLRPKGSV